MLNKFVHVLGNRPDKMLNLLIAFHMIQTLEMPITIPATPVIMYPIGPAFA